MTKTYFIPGEILYAANLNQAFANSVNIAGDNVYGNLVVANLTSNGSVTTDTLYANSATISNFTVTGNTTLQYSNIEHLTANSGNVTLSYANISNLVANTGNITLNSIAVNQLTANNGNLTVQYANITNITANSGNVTLQQANISNLVANSGNVTLISLATSKLTANSGNITLEYANVSNLVANNGNVTLNSIAVNRLLANNGNVTLQYANISNLVANTGNLTLNTLAVNQLLANNGNVTLHSVSTNQLTANNGNVTLQYANVSNLVANNGNVSLNSITVNQLTANNGNLTIQYANVNNLSTNSGNAILQTLNVSNIIYDTLDDRISLFFSHAVLDSTNNVIQLFNNNGDYIIGNVIISNITTLDGNIKVTNINTESIMMSNDILSILDDRTSLFFSHVTQDSNNNIIDLYTPTGTKRFSNVIIHDLNTITGNVSLNTINANNIIIDDMEYVIVDDRVSLFFPHMTLDSSNNVIDLYKNDGTKVFGELRISYVHSDDGDLNLSSINVGNNKLEKLDDRLTLFFPHMTLDSSNNVIDLYKNDGSRKYKNLTSENFSSNVVVANTLIANTLSFSNISVNVVTANSVILSQSPTLNSQAATKLYVDTAVASANGGSGNTSLLYLEPKIDFGAVGDGVTDDSNAVNACVSAAVNANARFIYINNDYYVPTLNKAIGDIITITSNNGTLISGPVRKEVIPIDAPPPRLPHTTLRLRRHCSQAVANNTTNNTITVVLVGDSVSTTAVTGMSLFATFNQKLKEALIRDNPGTTINYINRGIGGQNWERLNGIVDVAVQPEWYTSNTRPWLEYVEDIQPDIVIVSCARNGGSSFTFKHIRDAIATMNSWVKIPDIIMTNSMGETQTEGASPADNQRNGYEYAAAGIRSYAISEGYGLIDTETLESQVRFGYAQEFLPLLKNGGMIGSSPTGNYNLTLPWTCNTATYGYGGVYRINPDKWTALGNEITFQVGAAKTANANGCNFMIKREVGNNEIYWRITSTLISQGSNEDYIYRNWTSTNVTSNNTQYFSFGLMQQGSRVYFGLYTPGNSPAEPVEIANKATMPFSGYIPRCGGRYYPTITCAAGAVSGALTLLPSSDNINGGYLAVPHPRTLCMPQLTDKEFASPETTPYEPWGGGGPHGGALAAELIIDPVISINDFSA
jgi:hypothetical protein